MFIDRLEVLLSSPVFNTEERTAFLNLIATLATSGVIIVVSACRNDFYPLVVNYPSLMANKGNGGHFDLLAQTRAELMQMIRLPAVAANLKWSVDADTASPLDQILCAEAANNPDALPMLQYSLQELYLQRNESDELQVSVYKSLGGIEGAIGKKAEEIYQQLPAEHQPQLSTVLSRLVTLSPDGETITSRAARWSELTHTSENAFVQAMVNSRLFVSHLQNNEPCFSLAHEALLRRWPRASEWISLHKDSLTIKSRLQQLTERWLKEDKSSAYLLPQGKPLAEALRLQDMPVFTLDNNELALLNASQTKIKFKRWMIRSTITLLCFLTFTAIFMSVKSQQSEAFAQQKRLAAENLLGFMVGEFADKLRSVKRMDLLDGISNKALEYFAAQDAEYDSGGIFSLADSELNFKAKFQHAQTLEAMGEVAYSRAKTDEAEQAFASAKVILDKLYNVQPENMELLKNLGANVFWLGQLKYDDSDFDGSEPLFELYRDYSQRMNEVEPDNVDSWFELSSAENTLGSLNLKRQNYLQAKIAFGSSLGLIEKALVKQPNDNLLRSDKADTFSWLATTEQHLGNLSYALELHQLGQKELELALESDKNNANLLQRLAYSYWHQARLYDYIGEHTEAFKKTSQAIDILNIILKQDPKNELWHEQLYSLQIFQILLSSKIDDGDIFVATKRNKFLETVFNNPISQPNLPINIIKYFQVKKEWLQSRKFIKLTKNRFLELDQKTPDAPEYKLVKAELNLLQAKQFRHDLKIDDALQACQQTIKVLSPLLIKSRNVEYLVPYVQAHSCINKLYTIPDEVRTLKEMGIKILDFINPHKRKKT